MRLGSFDAERRIVVKPSDVNRMPDQDTQNLEDRKRGAWSADIGLQYAGNDTVARQASDGAVAMLCPQGIDSRGVTDLVVSRRPKYAELRMYEAMSAPIVPTVGLW